MSYSTNYALSLVPPKELTNLEWNHMEESIIKIFRAVNTNARTLLDEQGYSKVRGDWSECIVELRDFSKGYPEVVFVLEGNGEEPLDLWKLYVKDGKHFLSEAQIIFDEYDESKLT